MQKNIRRAEVLALRKAGTEKARHIFELRNMDAEQHKNRTACILPTVKLFYSSS